MLELSFFLSFVFFWDSTSLRPWWMPAAQMQTKLAWNSQGSSAATTPSMINSHRDPPACHHTQHDEFLNVYSKLKKTHLIVVHLFVRPLYTTKLSTNTFFMVIITSLFILLHGQDSRIFKKEIMLGFFVQAVGSTIICHWSHAHIL